MSNVNTNSSAPNSGTGTVTASIDNGFPYTHYSGVPRFFVHGINEIILRTVHTIDKSGTKTAINWSFPDGIRNGTHKFDKNDPDSLQPLEFSYRYFDNSFNDWLEVTYLKEHFGHIDVVFDLAAGTLKADFLFQFKTYDTQTVHNVSGKIDVAGLVRG